MTDEIEKTDPEQPSTEAMVDERAEPEPVEATGGAIERVGEEDEIALPAQLGATRYVLAGFFVAGMAVSFIVSKILNATWNKLTNTVWVSQHVPMLSRLSEDDRPTYTMLAGAITGLVVAVYAYRRSDVRTWTNEVASELSKVSWPTKKEVTNSTMVVIVTGAFATVFLALLDRFWGFVTNLVYGS
jgi:preprotein translocase subunit SecE